MSAQVEQAARQVDNGPNVSRVVQALHEAASAMVTSGHSLTAAVQQSRNFVSRTISGGGGGAVTGGTAGAIGALAVTGAANAGLSEADRAALSDYTGTGYFDMNRALRGQAPMNDAVAQRADAVSAALAKLPEKPQVSFRGTTLSDEQLERYRQNARLIERGFTSSSSNPGKAFAGNTRFFIQGKHGKDVAPYSVAGSESELLFDKESEFFVYSHSIDASGNHVIMLIEV